MARKSWKPSKALIQKEKEAAAKYSQEMDRKQREVLAGYPAEYQDEIIDAYRLMWNARDSLKQANWQYTITEAGVKQWKSENAVRNYKLYKAESDDFYSQYLNRKEAISKQFGIHSDTVAEHVKAVYIVSEQVDDLYMKGAFK